MAMEAATTIPARRAVGRYLMTADGAWPRVGSIPRLEQRPAVGAHEDIRRVPDILSNEVTREEVVGLTAGIARRRLDP